MARTKHYYHLTIRSSNDCIKIPFASSEKAWELRLRLRDERPDLTVEETIVTLHNDVDYAMDGINTFLRKETEGR